MESCKQSKNSLKNDVCPLKRARKLSSTARAILDARAAHLAFHPFSPQAGYQRSQRKLSVSNVALRGKVFFKSLENCRKIFPIVGKTGRIFQPLENFFPIIGKVAFGRRASRLAKTRGGGSGGGENLRGRGRQGGSQRGAVPMLPLLSFSNANSSRYCPKMKSADCP